MGYCTPRPEAKSRQGTARSLMQVVGTRGESKYAPDTFLYRTSSFRDRTECFRDTVWARCARHSAGRAVPGNRPTHSADLNGVSRCFRGHRGADRGHAARTANKWRREYALYG